MNQWYKHIIGARTIKTGLATFLTTLFCLLLNLTPIFAILTAIVSIEPTAKASLRKGYRRLPATVIGALFAVIFTYIFGDQSPFTYTFSAIFTIFINNYITHFKPSLRKNIRIFLKNAHWRKIVIF